MRQLIDLAAAVPKKEDAQKSVVDESVLSRVGSEAIQFVKSTGELIAFVAVTSIALVRLIKGRARFIFSDLRLLIQETGIQAVSIVSLISFLAGLIHAFVGILQLQMFGVQVSGENLALRQN